MKMIVVTTITSTLDVETMAVSHAVDIDDSDGVSEISRDVLGALLIGALHSTDRAVRKEFPRVSRIDNESEKED